jgi:hypothetical protein
VGERFAGFPLALVLDEVGAIPGQRDVIGRTH